MIEFLHFLFVPWYLTLWLQVPLLSIIIAYTVQTVFFIAGGDVGTTTNAFIWSGLFAAGGEVLAWCFLWIFGIPRFLRLGGPYTMRWVSWFGTLVALLLIHIPYEIWSLTDWPWGIIFIHVGFLIVLSISYFINATPKCLFSHRDIASVFFWNWALMQSLMFAAYWSAYLVDVLWASFISIAVGAVYLFIHVFINKEIELQYLHISFCTITLRPNRSHSFPPVSSH